MICGNCKHFKVDNSTKTHCCDLFLLTYGEVIINGYRYIKCKLVDDDCKVTTKGKKKLLGVML